MYFGVNYFGYFLLINLLLDLFEKLFLSRIVVVLLSLVKRVFIDFDNIYGEKGYEKFGRGYCMKGFYV